MVVVPVNTGGVLRLGAIAAWRFSVAPNFASSTKNTRSGVVLLAKVEQEPTGSKGGLAGSEGKMPGHTLLVFSAAAWAPS
jgi:hypothetical protein